ncbi:MAG: hypothetical protein IJQ10_03385 [Clostridia bacterium]|nr:hypothetical protein [Clostridia bacterium]
MDRSKSRIAAIMLSALACSGASKADTRALSTAGKILTALGAVVGATEIYNEVSAVVSKKQGKEPKWCTGRYSFYNLLSNSKKKSDEKPEEKPEKNQTFTLNDNQKSVIEAMFKNVVNESNEEVDIQPLKNFFYGEMLVGSTEDGRKGFEIFKKFLDGESQGKFFYESAKRGRIVVNDGKSSVTFYLQKPGGNKFALIYKATLVLKEK